MTHHRSDLQFAAHSIGSQGEETVAELDESTESTGQIDRRTGCACCSNGL
jgi:hypothetical protein